MLLFIAEVLLNHGQSGGKTVSTGALLKGVISRVGLPHEKKTGGRAGRIFEENYAHTHTQRVLTVAVFATSCPTNLLSDHTR